MNKRAILILGIVALILVSFSLGTAQKSVVSPKKEVVRVPADQIKPIKPPPASGSKDSCYLAYTLWDAGAYYAHWKLGDKVAIYFDPEDCGWLENYPFQLTDVHFWLYNPGGVDTVDLRFSVEVVCPDICDGPGIEIWKSQVYHITTFGDYVQIYFPDTVCLDKPFFFNVEYMSDYPDGMMPSLIFDFYTETMDTCYQWVWTGQPSWVEWHDFWYPQEGVRWVNLGISGFCGEEQTECGWWYWKPDTLPQAPSGMPDFDQNQDEWQCFCGPTAVANCLWWFDAVPTAGMDPADFIELLAGYFSTGPGGTHVDSIQAGLERYFEDYGFALTETTYWMPDFHEMEDSLKVCQDIILLLGFWWYEEDPQQFIRGDVDENGIVDGNDFTACQSGPPFSCDDAADVNDDGVLDYHDCDYLYAYLMGAGPPPPPPFPSCGVDPTADALDCADFPPCPGGGPGEWFREGGHFVTMAGVNSEKKEIAISDPDRDQCVQYPWWPGRVRTADHPPWGGYGPEFHNDPQFVSHDVYVSLLYPEFPSPGSEVWDLADYCFGGYKYTNMNVPERFRVFTKEAPKHYEYWHTEVEAAVMICPIPNRPPEINQPDFLEGFVDDEVRYEITALDPDGDVILDEASIDIQPGCGDYMITRVWGHGTSSGTWRIYWDTHGCTPCDTHMVIHDLTDERGAVAYCTTWVHLSEKEDTCWYWKPDTLPQAPSGMPDFDQNQDAWSCYCGPTAVANCLWWYGAVPVGWTPPQLIDTLARYFHTSPVWGTFVDTMQMGLEQYFADYGFAFTESTFVMPNFFEMEDSLKVCQDIILLLGFWWYEGTEQEFIRGDVDENGVVDENDVILCEYGGPFSCDDAADVNDDGVLNALDCDYLSDFLNTGVPPPPPPFPECGVDPTPDALGCADFPPCPGGGEWYREGGHYVTMAGVCSESLKIAISDPDKDAAVGGWPGRVRPPWHPNIGAYPPELHNDPQYVSHDMYQSMLDNPFPSPGNPFWEIDYSWMKGDFSGINVPEEFRAVTRPAPEGEKQIFATEVEYAVMICPTGEEPRECDENDPRECDTLWVECGKMLVPPGGGLVTVDMTIAFDESLMAIQVPLSYEGSPLCCDSMPDSENTVAKVFAGSVLPGTWIKVISIDHQAKTIQLGAVALMPPTDCLPPGKGHFATLTLFGDSCCTILLDTTTVQGNSVGFMECNDPDMILFYPVCRIDTCHIDRNNPPEIGQPDFLEGYVEQKFQYTIGGTDPDGDVIQDSASINIIPGCGSGYSIDRISGHGTSTGTWQITWYTDGCTPCDTHLVIHDLTDVRGATAYCTTRVHLSVWPDTLWYWKPDTTNAPSGMPDFDQNQDAWVAYCGPTAVANCLWWYGAVPVGWTPPQLIDTLARRFGTSASGTDVYMMQAGLEQYFADYGFVFTESTFVMPNFYEMEDSLKVCQDIILLLGFWFFDEGSGTWYREGGHYVTMAGVCSESLKIAISDPAKDAAVSGWPGRVRPPWHPGPGTYPPELHNDPTYVSHDMYNSILDNPFPSPGNPFWEIDYQWWMLSGFSGINVPEEFRAVTRPAPEGGKQIFATEVEYAVMICPRRENNPPEIEQPDTLYGYQVCDTVIYQFSGTDPDGDVILDGASLAIEPSCGTYSVTRLTGHGMSTGTWEITWETAGCEDSIYYKIIVDLTDNQGNTSWCTTYCHLDPNNPPIITQPDSVDGYINDLVEYTITGADPDSDVILDQASIDIVPSCGVYSITRISGHGTASGTWQISWATNGCLAATYLVIHDLTDGCDTSYCTTYVHLAEKPGWHWKDPYEDYAPNGMPDIDQRQDNWVKMETGQFSFCGPCAVANCFKWFDSKYNVPPGFPGDGIDMFPLVRDYMDNLPPWNAAGIWDDHDPWNVDHIGTPWSPPVIPPPPPTAQPFIPGSQPQPSGMDPWGELVERLAWYFDTDGIQTGYCNHAGTNIVQMQDGIQMWFDSEIFPDGSTLADTLCEVTTPMPTFAYVESLVEKCEDVILLLGFWYENPPGSGIWFRVGGHYVTVAGVNSTDLMIAFCDPFVDAAELGLPGRVGDGLLIPHTHGAHDPTVHNDEGNVSQDIYFVSTEPVSPGGLWWIPEYAVYMNINLWMANFSAQNVPEEFLPVTAPWDGMSPIYTEVEYCVHISPWDYRGDINVPGGDGVVDIGDVVFMLNFLYRGGAPPDPYLEGDINCDGVIDLGDVVRLINYLFKGWPVPRCCDP